MSTLSLYRQKGRIMKTLSPSLISIARHTGAISWSVLLDTAGMLIKGTGLAVLLALIALLYSDAPLTVQVTSPSGRTLLGTTPELILILRKLAAVGIGLWLLCIGLFMALTGRFVFMSRTFAAISAAASDLLRHGPGLARRARLRTERQD